MSRSTLIAAVMTVAVALFGVSGHAISNTPAQESGEPLILPVDPAPLVVETSQGRQSFTVEVADNDGERSAGLMFRTDMADSHGMLFVFEQTREVAFWMKNTPLPLDLIFIREDGTIAAIMQGEPQSTAVITPGAPVRFVLELKAGTAQKAGMADGDRMRHPQIDSIAGAG